MGGLNHPDLATKAGEVPLPQSDDSDVDDPMDVDGREQTDENNPAYDKNIDLVHLAENALPLVERNNGHDTSKNEHSRPARPKILTQTSLPEPKDVVHVKTEYRQSSPSPGANPPKRTKYGSNASHSPSRSAHRKGDPDSAAISPMLRRFTIPNSERSPTETLPAMQQSPPSSSSKSPNGQHSLPSLRAIQLEPLLDGRSPKENMPHGINRPPFPLSNTPVTSPPMSSIAPRPAQYPSPQTLMNGHFHQPYPHGQPSPAYSDASPRDSANMSPPGKPIHSQYFPGGRTPQSEELTPQSAESHLSTSSFSTVSSPHPHPLDMDRSRPVLPPLSGMAGGSLIIGNFKCEHAGCTAPAFQTQYLLNSHANVHSQNRPHYCPVEGCARSEGGKGFKRKNEMIRHGLVHESPGYICPFCPEREHKYPRPDNLQRHVRVNHIDKDTNDPQLREVLAQRCEGGSRGRRRRLGS
ncbi:hypothetical protein HO173_001995 [Letharia columbiana]|uniref:C2H2-type domain-containing protein n=1 Tax=Letharia columbiana TaxID=112416 RepID=A0A8H6G4G6_9LECA|nr:uncharacterized protein HO173_001995 [Letharia columbiana]KAF6240384.1 hypothetical protein HO173_001995 [Letharia columbiana]